MGEMILIHNFITKGTNIFHKQNRKHGLKTTAKVSEANTLL